MFIISSADGGIDTAGSLLENNWQELKYLGALFA